MSKRKRKKQGRKKPLEVLHTISRAITSAASVDKVYEIVLESMAKAVGVEKASIMKYDPDSKRLRIVAAKGMPKHIKENVSVGEGEGISGKVFETSRPILLDEGVASNLISNRKKYRGKSLISAPVMCFPMRVGAYPIGVINVTDKLDGTSFSKRDLKLVMAVADQVAAYMRLCDLTEHLVKTQRIARDLEIAREIQRSLLPSELPSFRNVEVAGRCVSAREVGGDYFDVLDIGKGRLVGVVADVSGHSVAAALIMSAFRSTIRAVATSCTSPDKLLGKLNRLLYEDLAASERFVSVACLYCDVRSGSLSVATAGHYPILVWDASRKIVVEVGSGGPLLGVERNATFSARCLEFERGDIAVAYTDGILETRKKGRRSIDISRLKRTVSSNFSKDANKLSDTIVSLVKSRFEELEDDITVLVVKKV